MAEGQNQPKFKVWWDEKEEIVRILATGDQTEEIAREMVAKERQLITSLNKKGIKVINVLCDVAKAGTASSPARKIFADWIKEGKVNKFALCGGGILQNTTANFVFFLSGFKDVKFFTSEDRASKWLKEA